MAELNLPQAELLPTSSEELEVVPERVEEVAEAGDFADMVLADVVPITEAPGYKALGNPQETDLETSPVPVTAAGEPVDMAKYRREQAARQAVAEALAGEPESRRIEEMAA